MAQPELQMDKFTKVKKIHPGNALGIIPTGIPRPNAQSIRYPHGDLDMNSTMLFLRHLRNTEPELIDIMRIRGRLRHAFPGTELQKKSIQDACEYVEDCEEMVDIYKREQKPKKEARRAAKKEKVNSG